MRRLNLTIAVVFSTIGMLIILWFCLRGFFIEKFINPSGLIHLPDAGLVGDFIGGFVGVIFTFVGIILLYETLKFQRKELSESKRVFTKQQFDNSFFELLRLYNETINSIYLKINNKVVRGKDFFSFHKQELQDVFTTNRTLSYNRKNAVKLYEKLYVDHIDITSTYFRTLYRIYALIDNSELSEEDKVEYSKILRAQLSNSELFFIRYNAMTRIGGNSAYYINKYNYLKHLSHFELLEFKDWWSKLNSFESNGVGFIFKELKGALKEFLKDEEHGEMYTSFKNNRYRISVTSETFTSFNITLIKDSSKNSRQPEIVDGLEKYTDKEIENLLECIIKEFIIHSNFNMYNERKELKFDSETSIDGTKTIITVSVKNKKDNPLLVSFPH